MRNDAVNQRILDAFDAWAAKDEKAKSAGIADQLFAWAATRCFIKVKTVGAGVKPGVAANQRFKGVSGVSGPPSKELAIVRVC